MSLYNARIPIVLPTTDVFKSIVEGWVTKLYSAELQAIINAA